MYTSTETIPALYGDNVAVKISNCDINELQYKTLTAIHGCEPDSEQIVFECSDGNAYLFWHEQDCCEYVRVADVIGDPECLIGAPLALVEEVKEEMEDEDFDGSLTWTFYKFATVKGYVTIRWLGESNGYYSEAVDFGKIIPPGKFPKIR